MNDVEMSVVIPAFNAADTLGEQLKALAAQDVHFSWEVLVCDNGSTDGTAALALNWQQRMVNLRLVDASARRGPAAARNVGAAHATGAFIAFCDADDVIGDGWLAAMYAALQSGPFVAGSVDDQRFASSRGALSWSVRGLYTKDFLPHLPAAATNNMGIHRAVLEEVGGFEEALRTNEDTDLCWRVQLAGYPLVHHPEIVLHVRKRDGLRAVFRQAYAYGAGDKQLRHRYARVIAARSTEVDVRTEGVRASRRALDTLRRATAKIHTVRRPADLSDQVWRLGFTLGDRFGSLDPSAPQLAP